MTDLFSPCGSHWVSLISFGGLHASLWSQRGVLVSLRWRDGCWEWENRRAGSGKMWMSFPEGWGVLGVVSFLDPGVPRDVLEWLGALLADPPSLSLSVEVMTS